MNAADIAVALGDARREGRGWRCRCPLHNGRSLTLRDGDDGCVLVTCWAGCDRRDVLSELRRRGLLDPRATDYRGPSAKTSQREEAVRSDARRSKVALAIWQSTRPAGGTLAERYLASRGLHLPPPPTIRFHPGLKHPAGSIWPAMVALVTCGVDDTPLAIHRTFLARDGQGKARIEPEKMMFGPCRGGAVRLATPGGVLMVGEGIETCLAAMQATGHPAWAALSTSGLRALDLPADVRDIIVLADGDEPGAAAAGDCAWRWKRQGRRVRIARPAQGMDFNDMLMGRAPHVEERA
jgi:putative DNA primase/helicase